MKPHYKIEKIKIEATLEEWQQYYNFWMQCNESKKPLRYAALEDFREHWQDWIKKGADIFLVWNQDKEIGYFSLKTEFKDQADKRCMNFWNSLSDQGLNESLLKGIGEAFLVFDPDAKFLLIPSKDGENDFVEKVVNAEIADFRELYSLFVEKVDVAKMDEWIAISEKKFPKYRLQFYEDIPDDLLEEYSAVFSQLMEDIPTNSRSLNTTITPETVKERQIEGKKTQQCSYRYLVFNEENKLIAKTNISLNKVRTKSMYQYMTGVLEAYRGQGLSKWLKAAMFKKIVADFPALEVINTEVHTTNEASRVLNLKMGYVKKGFKKNWLIPKENIVKLIVAEH